MNDSTEDKLTNIFHKIWSVITKHPIIIYNITTSFGLFLIFLYFIRINYFPSLLVEEILLLTLVSSLIGIFLFLILLLYLVAPAVLYSSSRQRDFNGVFYFEDDKDKTLKYDFLTIGIPFIVFILSFYFENEYKILEQSFGKLWPLFWLSLQLLAPTVVWFFINKKNHIRKLSGYLITIIMTELCFFASMYVYFMFLSKSDIVNNTLNELYLIFLIASMAVFLVSFSNVKKPAMKIFGNILTLIVLIISTNGYYIIPYRIMEVLNLGQVNIEKLTIHKDGCSILGKDVKSNCTIKNYKLIWRLGDTFVIEQLQKEITEKKNRTQRYYIPKKYILSWNQVNNPRNYYNEKKEQLKDKE